MERRPSGLYNRLKSNALGLISFSIIMILALVAIFAYQLAPDASKNANQMHLSIHSQPPGFEVQILRLPLQQSSGDAPSFFNGHSIDHDAIPIEDWHIQNGVLEIRPFGRRQGYYEPIATNRIPQGQNLHDFVSQNVEKQQFLLGTDKYGRDLLSRLIIGSRVSLAIGFVAVFISLLIGIVLGAISGYFGGKIDAAIMWLINIVWSIPTLLLVIAITLVLGRGFWQVFIAVGLSMWVEVARLVRGQVIGLKERTFIQAAHTLGFSNGTIIFSHLLPLLVAPLIVLSAANFASAILIESGLSFLGIGAQPPIPSWGGMIKDHFRYLLLGKPYLALLPGLCIMLLVLAFMTLGNSLRDALDVKN